MIRPQLCLAGIVVSLLASASAIQADSVLTKTRTVTELAKGVYSIRHPDSPDTFPQSNTTVIIGEKEVLVVDSCYLPSSAAEDIAQIRTWTDKPVRYLVNTHWHYDHTMGNGVYAAAFPGLAIIAHRETRKHIAGYNPGWFERFPKRAEAFAARAREGKSVDGEPLTPEDIALYEKASGGVAAVAEEYLSLADHPPNVGFDNRLDIDLGNREVQILHLGRGNTSGDAVVFLPAEKIVIAGDLLAHPVPYLGAGILWISSRHSRLSTGSISRRSCRGMATSFATGNTSTRSFTFSGPSLRKSTGRSIGSATVTETTTK